MFRPAGAVRKGPGGRTVQPEDSPAGRQSDPGSRPPEPQYQHQCQTRPSQWEAGSTPDAHRARPLISESHNHHRKGGTHVRMGRPGRPGPGAGAARRRRQGRRRAGLRHLGRRAGAARLEDDPRVAVHRPARLRTVHRRQGLRGGSAVHQPGPRAGRGAWLRFLRQLPHQPHRYARRCRRDPHRPALHRREGDPGAGPPRPALMRPSGAGRSSSWRTPTASPKARATSC